MLKQAFLIKLNVIPKKKKKTGQKGGGGVSRKGKCKEIGDKNNKIHLYTQRQRQKKKELAKINNTM